MENHKNQHRIIKALLLISLFSLSACVSIFEKQSHIQKENNHSVIKINDGMINLPNDCMVIQLNYQEPELAMLLCDLGKNNPVIFSLWNIRAKNSNKEKIIAESLKNKNEIEGYICGTVRYPLFSCYSKNLGVVINSEQSELVVKFIIHQRTKEKETEKSQSTIFNCLFPSHSTHQDCTEEDADDQEVNPHSVLFINKGMFHFPDECAIDQLDYYKSSDFATLLCSIDKGTLVAVDFINLRFKSSNKENLVVDSLHDKKQIDGYTCGTVMQSRFSCYSRNLGITVNSKSPTAVEALVRYQKTQAPHQEP